MSDSQKSDMPTNEEIIKDLTKDLEFSCATDDKTTSVKFEGESPSKGPEASSKKDDFIPKDFSDSDEDADDDKTKTTTVADHDEDEKTALELDKSSTEEEKLDRKQKALDLKLTGNEEFKLEKYLESIDMYTKALRLCPLVYKDDRSILYCNRAASKMKLQQKETAIDDCTKAIKLNANYLRAYLRRAKLYEESDKLEESLLDYKKIVDLDPQHKEAQVALIRLPPLINEKNEKLKTEMLGKLKDLGNMILRPFGLSTDNFNLQKDSNSGGYSVNFKQN